MPGRPLGVGLIGCGDIAPAHAKALAQAEGASLVACTDVVDSSAKSLGEEHGVPWTTNLDELLARPEVEIVTLATPAFTHDELTEQAAKAGKHVLSEKPLAPDLPDADRMIAVCESAGVALSTCFAWRYTGAAKWLRRLLKAGALGRVIGIRLRGMGEKKESYWTGGFSGRTKTDWRKSRLASLRYDNDAIGSVEGASCFFGGSTDHDVTVLGTKGQVRFGLFNGKAEAFLTEAAEDLPAGEWTSRQFDDKVHVEFYNELAAALRAGGTPPVTGLDGRKALEVVLAIYRSAERGQPVTLPL